jgi:hypothetical protein
VAAGYFKGSGDIFRNLSLSELLDTMDSLGVGQAVLTNNCEDIDEHVLSFVSARPDRFVLSAYVNPRNGLSAVRALASFAAQHPVVLARITPFMIDLPANDREYYPIYAKCVELGIPVSILTGMPGPAVYARWQDPKLLDDVLRVLSGAHGCDGAWCRPVVAGRHPTDDQESESIHDDLGMGAEPAAGRTYRVHELWRAQPNHVCLGPFHPAHAPVRGRGIGTVPSRGCARTLSAGQRSDYPADRGKVILTQRGYIASLDFDYRVCRPGLFTRPARDAE